MLSSFLISIILYIPPTTYNVKCKEKDDDDIIKNYPDTCALKVVIDRKLLQSLKEDELNNFTTVIHFLKNLRAMVLLSA